MNNGWVEGIKKKKVIVTLLVMILVFPLVWVESSQAAGDTYIITPDVGVNLRAEPKQEGATVTKLKQGYRVEVLEESGEWLKVSYEGKEGYVKSEYLKPLDIDLVAAYKHYATVLEESMGDHYYSLLYDFTQDGLEELYIVERADGDGGGFRHRMLSGQKELFDETVYNEGLEIYWDDYNYYLVTLHERVRGGSSFKPSDLGITSQHEFINGDLSVSDFSVIRSGNLSINKTVGKSAHIWEGAVFETNGEEFEIDDSTEMESYIVEDEKVTKEQWDKVVSVYNNAPNRLWLFTYESILGVEPNDEYEPNFDETLKKLYGLYEKYNDSPIELLLEETKIEEIEQYINYMLQNSPVYDVNNGGMDYLTLFELAQHYALYSEEFGELYDEEGYRYKYPKSKVDEWTYNNFGVKMDNQKLKDQILRHETRYTASIETHDEYYIAGINGDLGIGNEPYITNSHQLKNDFIALEYVHGYMKELSVMTIEPDYIIVKKVEAANGEKYYPYIDTVQILENIDYDALNKYAEMLDVVKDHKKVEPVEEPADKQTEEALVKESKGQGKTTNSVLYTLVIVGGLVLVVAVVVMNVRKRRSGDKIKKSATIMTIIFSVIIVGAVIFISINPLQSQTESDISLSDDTQEDSSSVTDDEQELNDFEYGSLDSLKKKVTDVNGVTGIQIGDADPIMDMAENARIGFTNEDAARTFYDDFRIDYQNALNTGDFDLVSNYFEDSSAIKQNYKDFVLTHRDWDVDYSYTFLSNTTELEATSANTIVVTAHELFDLYKQDSNPKTSKNDRKRNYTLKLVGNSFYISNIENLDGAPPVKETTKSTNSGTKSDYMASIQYAESLLNDAGTSGDFKDNLSDAYEAWDDELNKIYGLLKEKLPPQKMEVLRTEQRAWIKERDKQTNPDVVGSLAEIETLNDLARERTLYLIDMYFDEE